MNFFAGAHENKVDKKCRVSIPAMFRMVMGDRPAFYAFPSWLEACVECRMPDQMDSISQAIETLPELTRRRDQLEQLIFGQASLLQYDFEGRLVLPKFLITAAGITDRAVFVGKRKSFQIWEPDAHRAYQKGVLDDAAADKLALPRRPQAGLEALDGPVESGT